MTHARLRISFTVPPDLLIWCSVCSLISLPESLGSEPRDMQILTDDSVSLPTEANIVSNVYRLPSISYFTLFSGWLCPGWSKAPKLVTPFSSIVGVSTGAYAHYS